MAFVEKIIYVDAFREIGPEQGDWHVIPTAGKIDSSAAFIVMAGEGCEGPRSTTRLATSCKAVDADLRRRDTRGPDRTSIYSPVGIIGSRIGAL